MALFFSVKISQCNFHADMRCDEQISVHIVEAEQSVRSVLLRRGPLQEEGAKSLRGRAK